MKINKLTAGIRAAIKLAISKITGRPIPVWAWNYITNRCNLNCKYCFVSPYWDKKEDLTFAELCKIFDEEKELGVEMVTLLGGEPMLRQDFGEIINYLDRKGMIIDVITNGYFMQRYENVLDKIDSICISIDGNEETTDALRGKGAYKQAIKVIKFAKSKGMTVRIHGVITKYSIDALPQIAWLCKELGVTATYAMPDIHQNEDILKVSDDKMREFWKLYLKMKKEGVPFAQTDCAVESIIHWPYPYFKILTRNDLPLPENIRNCACACKENLVCLDGSGEIYPCTEKFNQKGLNAKDVGVKKALEYMRQTTDCVACGKVSCVDIALRAHLDHRILFETTRIFLKNYLKI